MKFTRHKSHATSIIFICGILIMVCGMCGCDAFVRKFTRKSKKEKVHTEELVLVPEEYKPPVRTKEEEYRKYFLFWKSWQDELINSLSSGASQKKMISCTDEAINNLEGLRLTLKATLQNKLDIYINQLKDLRKEIEGDLYGDSVSTNRLTAERLKRAILRDFSYKKIKDSLA